MTGPSDVSSLRAQFRLRGVDGAVHVEYARNDAPGAVGSGPAAYGFPWCHADVDYPARGYDAVLGWVQLVRSDDNDSGGRSFELDPLAFLGDVPHPFCWLGLEPQLFDAPSRSSRSDLDWLAHSFLCVPDGPSDRMEAHALLGFAWGFAVRGGAIELVPPYPLTAADWDAHAEHLAARCPDWAFPAGFRQD